MVEGNYIGINVSGSAALGNRASGVAIYAGASANTIGGKVAGAGNVISGNGSNGVYISDSGNDRQRGQGRLIGTELQRHRRRAQQHRGGDPERRDRQRDRRHHSPPPATSSRATPDGVDIVDSGTKDNLVEGNYIGMAPAARRI